MVSVAFAKPVQPRVQWCLAGTGASVIRAENVSIRDVERNARAPCVGSRSIKLCGSSAARHRARSRPGVLAQFPTGIFPIGSGPARAADVKLSCIVSGPMVLALVAC